MIYYDNQFEYISRARKRLILIMDSKDLESVYTFYMVMKELRNHSESCKNDMCKEHKWDKKEVIEVVEVDNGDVSEIGEDSREGGYKERLETIKMVDGIPICEMGHNMEISSFADSGYDSGFYCNVCYEHYSTPFDVGRWFCEVCYSTKYGVRDEHGKEKSFIFLVHTKGFAEDGVLSFNVML